MREKLMGKNKGDLEGKEFGQARAAEAKSKLKEKKEKLKEKVSSNDKKVSDAKKKAAEAKDKAERDLQEGRIDKEKYAQKIEKIKLVEELSQKLEAELSKHKEQ